MSRENFSVNLARWPSLDAQFQEKTKIGIKRNEILADWLAELEFMRNGGNAPILPVQPEIETSEPDLSGIMDDL